MENETVVFDEELTRFVHEKIASGEFQSSHEVVEAGLRALAFEGRAGKSDDELKLYTLRAAIQKGLDSGLADGTTENVFDRVRQRVGLPVRTR